MSFFKELKYQLIGTFNDLTMHVSFNGEDEEGKSLNYKDRVLSFQCNEEFIYSKLVYDEKDNELVEMEIINASAMETVKFIFLPEELLYRKYKIDENLNPIGSHLEEKVITDKYIISDIIVEFKRKHKSTNKIYRGSTYRLPISW